MNQTLHSRSTRTPAPARQPVQRLVLVKGMETLGLRVERSLPNAAKVADALASHSAIGRTLYPAARIIAACARGQADVGFGGRRGLRPEGRQGGGVQGAIA